MITKIPRLVAFNKEGKAICAGLHAISYEREGWTCKILFLPTDHYDFVGYDVKGKTLEQILNETK